MTSKQKKVVELLKSGNFTIAYHDNVYPCLYKGKMAYSELPKREEYEFVENYEGYTPEVVFLLIEALGGISLSI